MQAIQTLSISQNELKLYFCSHGHAGSKKDTTHEPFVSKDEWNPHAHTCAW